MASVGNKATDGARRGAKSIPILVNSEGGTAAAAGAGLAQTIGDACRDAGLQAEVHLLKGAEIAAAVEAHADRPLIVVGGGDGTLGCAAGALLRCGSAAALGILPLGTHNHLARQLDIPNDLAAAIRVLAAGRKRKIDVATVNDAVFLNNASIGLYPLLVRTREGEQRRHGLPKWLANLIAARTVLRRLKHHRLQVKVAEATQSIRTPLLFVGNNVYSLESGHIGERTALDEGTLSVFAVASGTRLAVLWFALRTLIGRSDPEKDFAALEACEDFTVDAHAQDIHIALDGEVVQIQTPLHFGIKPMALTVIGPT